MDYSEIFSPVINNTSIRLLLALIAQYDLKLEQLHFKIAFLHGYLQEEILMGKQRLRQWNERFNATLLTIYLKEVSMIVVSILRERKVAFQPISSYILMIFCLK